MNVVNLRTWTLFFPSQGFLFSSHLFFPPVHPRECFVVCKEGNENVFKACDDDDDVDGFFFQLPTFSFPFSSLAFTQLAIFCFVDSFFSFSPKDCASALIFPLEKCLKKRSSLVSERRGKKVLFGLVQIFF